MVYLDTSALAKLVIEEPESAALRDFLASRGERSRITSALARAELLRTAQRRGEPAVSKARDVLETIAELTLTRALLDRAGALAPEELRTLDAIHLASALELGGDLQHVVAYDRRLLEAARRIGVPALAPT